MRRVPRARRPRRPGRLIPTDTVSRSGRFDGVALGWAHGPHPLGADAAAWS